MSDWVRSLADTSEQRSRAAILAAKKRSWVEGTEMTAEELERVQPTLKEAFLERESRRAKA
jgi:hypothetical protein